MSDRVTDYHAYIGELETRIEALEAALRSIASKCPATCDITLAHEMAEEAEAALAEGAGQMRMTDTPYDAAMSRSKQELARQVVDCSARIEALEAALREIMDCEELDAFTLQDIARAALAPEQEK